MPLRDMVQVGGPPSPIIDLAEYLSRYPNITGCTLVCLDTPLNRAVAQHHQYEGCITNPPIELHYAFVSPEEQRRAKEKLRIILAEMNRNIRTRLDSREGRRAG